MKDIPLVYFSLTHTCFFPNPSWLMFMSGQTTAIILPDVCKSRYLPCDLSATTVMLVGMPAVVLFLRIVFQILAISTAFETRAIQKNSLQWTFHKNSELEILSKSKNTPWRVQTQWLTILCWTFSAVSSKKRSSGYILCHRKARFSELPIFTG